MMNWFPAIPNKWSNVRISAKLLFTVSVVLTAMANDILVWCAVTWINVKSGTELHDSGSKINQSTEQNSENERRIDWAYGVLRVDVRVLGALSAAREIWIGSIFISFSFDERTCTWLTRVKWPGVERLNQSSQHAWVWPWRMENIFGDSVVGTIDRINRKQRDSLDVSFLRLKWQCSVTSSSSVCCVGYSDCAKCHLPFYPLSKTQMECYWYFSGIH